MGDPELIDLILGSCSFNASVGGGEFLGNSCKPKTLLKASQRIHRHPKYSRPIGRQTTHKIGKTHPPPKSGDLPLLAPGLKLANEIGATHLTRLVPPTWRGWRRIPVEKATREGFQVSIGG